MTTPRNPTRTTRPTSTTRLKSTVRPAPTTAPTSPTDPANSGLPGPLPGGAGAGAGGGVSSTEQIARVLNTPLMVARRVLPNSPVPVVLGTGALLLAGVVELPVAGALGLGYLALRSWRTPR